MKQPITIAVPLDCNKHTCGRCDHVHHEEVVQYGQWTGHDACKLFSMKRIGRNYKGKRLPECKAAEIKENNV